MAQIQIGYESSKGISTPERVAPLQGVQTSPPPVMHVPINPPPQPISQTGDNPYQYRTSPLVSLNWNYLKSAVGVLSLFIVLHEFIALLVMVVHGSHYSENYIFGDYLGGAYGFYVFACVAGFFFSASVLFIGTLQFPQRNPYFPWALAMVIGCGLMAFFELIASSLVASRAFIPRDGACAVLGFILFQGYVGCLAVTLPDAIKEIKGGLQTSSPQHIRDVNTIECPPSYLESTQHPPPGNSNPI